MRLAAGAALKQRLASIVSRRSKERRRSQLLRGAFAMREKAHGVIAVRWSEWCALRADLVTI
jgi:hypothetical protein